MRQVLNLFFKVRSQREKGEEVEGELQRQLARVKGEVVQLFFLLILYYFE